MTSFAKTLKKTSNRHLFKLSLFAAQLICDGPQCEPSDIGPWKRLSMPIPKLVQRLSEKGRHASSISPFSPTKLDWISRFFASPPAGSLQGFWGHFCPFSWYSLHIHQLHLKLQTPATVRRVTTLIPQASLLSPLTTCESRTPPLPEAARSDQTATNHLGSLGHLSKGPPSAHPTSHQLGLDTDPSVLAVPDSGILY